MTFCPIKDFLLINTFKDYCLINSKSYFTLESFYVFSILIFSLQRYRFLKLPFFEQKVEGAYRILIKYHHIYIQLEIHQMDLRRRFSCLKPTQVMCIRVEFNSGVGRYRQVIYQCFLVTFEYWYTSSSDMMYHRLLAIFHTKDFCLK